MKTQRRIEICCATKSFSMQRPGDALILRTFGGLSHLSAVEMRGSKPSRRAFPSYAGEPRTDEGIRFSARTSPAIFVNPPSPLPAGRANVFLHCQSSSRIEECSDGYPPLPPPSPQKKKMIMSNVLSEDGMASYHQPYRSRQN